MTCGKRPMAPTLQSECSTHAPCSTVEQDKARLAHPQPTHTLKEHSRQTGCEEFWVSAHNSQRHRDLDNHASCTLPATPGTFPTPRLSERLLPTLPLSALAVSGEKPSPAAHSVVRTALGAPLYLQRSTDHSLLLRAVLVDICPPMSLRFFTAAVLSAPLSAQRLPRQCRLSQFKVFPCVF